MSKMLRRNGSYRKAGAGLKYCHGAEFGICANIGKGDGFFQFPYERHVHEVPDGFLLGGARLVVVALSIKLCGVGVGGRGDFSDTVHTRYFAARMIEKHAISNLHIVAHEVASLKIPYTSPRSFLVCLECIYRVALRLRLHQPVFLLFHTSRYQQAEER